jgi:hypothetical protein
MKIATLAGGDLLQTSPSRNDFEESRMVASLKTPSL